MRKPARRGCFVFVELLANRFTFLAQFLAADHLNSCLQVLQSVRQCSIKLVYLFLVLDADFAWTMASAYSISTRPKHIEYISQVVDQNVFFCTIIRRFCRKIV